MLVRIRSLERSFGDDDDRQNTLDRQDRQDREKSSESDSPRRSLVIDVFFSLFSDGCLYS